MLYDIVYTAKMVVCFNDIIDAGGGGIGNDAFGLKDMAGLFFRELAALYVVGVVGERYLYFMVDATFDAVGHLFSQNGKQGHFFAMFAGAWRERGVLGDIPCFTGKKSTVYFAAGAIMAGCALGNVVFIGKLGSRNVLHDGEFYSISCRYRQEKSDRCKNTKYDEVQNTKWRSRENDTAYRGEILSFS